MGKGKNRDIISSEVYKFQLWKDRKNSTFRDLRSEEGENVRLGLRIPLLFDKIIQPIFSLLKRRIKF